VAHGHGRSVAYAVMRRRRGRCKGRLCVIMRATYGKMTNL